MDFSVTNNSAEHAVTSGELFCGDGGLHVKRTCLVDGCCVDLSGLSKYCQQRRVCPNHIKAESVKRRNSNELWRFCQQCGKLEPLSAFDESKRSCRKQLARRRVSRAASTCGERPPAGVAFVPIIKTESMGGMHAEAQTASVMPAAVALAAAAPEEEEQDMNSHLQQQLMLYQQKCAVLRMQIQLLEEQQALGTSVASNVQQEQCHGLLQGFSHATTAGTSCQSPLTPGSAEVSAPQITMQQAFDAYMGPHVMRQVSECSLASTTSAVAMLSSCISSGTGGALSTFTSGVDVTAPCLLQVPLMGQGSSALLAQGSSAGNTCSALLPPACGPTSAAVVGMHGQHSQPLSIPHGGAQTSAQGVMSGLCANSFVSEPLVNWSPIVPVGAELLPYGCLPQSQHEQPQLQPSHTQQLSSGAPVAWSAPLPRHADSQSLPSTAYGNAFGNMVQARQMTEAAPVAHQPLLFLTSDEDMMECDTAETIEDILEMALLEAAAEARQAQGILPAMPCNSMAY